MTILAAKRASRRVIVLAVSMLFATSCSASSTTFSARDPHSPLHLVRTIVLSNVRGRIDHMALDTRSNHLFVAELGNGSVDDVDLASSKVVGRISGLHEPQGVAWLAAQEEIAVACGDGTVRFYRSSDRQEVAKISLGDDADNVRVDPRNGDLVVGYGSGALAVMDPSTHHVVRQLKLPRHPEAFEILGSRVLVNVPDAHAIVLADLDVARVIRTIGTGTRFGNYPMASDAAGTRIAVAFRMPNLVELLDASSTAALFSTSACGDADDLYFRSGQVVLVCGSGAVELIDLTGTHRSLVVSTGRGARTGLLAGDQLFVAVPARQNPAAIWQLQFR